MRKLITVFAILVVLALPAIGRATPSAIQGPYTFNAALGPISGIIGFPPITGSFYLGHVDADGVNFIGFVYQRLNYWIPSHKDPTTLQTVPAQLVAAPCYDAVTGDYVVDTNGQGSGHLTFTPGAGPLVDGSPLVSDSRCPTWTFTVLIYPGAKPVQGGMKGVFFQNIEQDKSLKGNLVPLIGEGPGA